MIDIYSSWTDGLETDREALELIKKSGILCGIEVWTPDLVGNIRKNRLKVSLHNPIKTLKLDLVDQDMISELKKKKNSFIIDKIVHSDSEAVGFHLYFKPNPVMFYLLKKAPLPKENFVMLDENKMLDMIIKNLSFLHDKINKASKRPRKIAFETYPYSEAKHINVDGRELMPEFQQIFDIAGRLSSVEFIKSVLEDDRIKRRKVGFLFDVSHVFIAANTRVQRKEISIGVEEYIDKIISATAGRVHELHINAAKDLGNGHYADSHCELVKGEKVSEAFFRIARKVLKANPDIHMMAIEFDSGLPPVEHAKKLIEQAKLVAKELKIR